MLSKCLWTYLKIHEKVMQFQIPSPWTRMVGLFISLEVCRVFVLFPSLEFHNVLLISLGFFSIHGASHSGSSCSSGWEAELYYSLDHFLPAVWFSAFSPPLPAPPQVILHLSYLLSFVLFLHFLQLHLLRFFISALLFLIPKNAFFFSRCSFR